MEKWLILGWSETIAQVANAVASSPVREITGVITEKQALDPSYPLVDFHGLPETILLQHQPDVVICGPHEAFDFAPLARIAVQSETTLIVEHGNFDSILSFELEMLRHEATGTIQNRRKTESTDMARKSRRQTRRWEFPYGRRRFDTGSSTPHKI